MPTLKSLKPLWLICALWLLLPGLRLSAQVLSPVPNFVQTESFGTKLRRLSKQAQAGNAWSTNRPAMHAFVPWQPSTTYGGYQKVVNGGKIYALDIAGTSAGYVFTVTSANATAGATYTNNSVTFTVLTTIAAGTTLTCSASGAPAASGTLTKASGTGDATITFSAFANAGGPTQTNTTSTADGSAQWLYAGTNTVTSDPSLSQPAWVASTAYSLNAQVLNGGNVYACTVAGTSTTGSGPSGTSNAIGDGTAKWSYMGVYRASPYTGDYPTYAYSTTTTLAVTYPTASGKFTVLRSWPLLPGSGYAVGDTITLTGGTASQQAILTVASVNSTTAWAFTVSGVTTTPTAGATYTNNSVTYTVVGASISTGSGVVYTISSTASPTTSGSTLTKGTGTGDATLTFSAAATNAISTLSVSNPGSYTLMAGGPGQSQGSTSGSGTGATFVVNYSPSPWWKMRGCYTGGIVSSFARIDTFQPTAYATPVALHCAVEFYSDAPTVQVWMGNGANVNVHVIIDGNRLNNEPLTTNGSTNNYHTWDFAGTSGAKKRLWRLEFMNAAPTIGGILVPTGYTVWPPDDQDKVTVALIMDSIEAGSNFGPYIYGNTVAQRIGHELGWNNIYPFTQGGTGYTNRGAAGGVTTDNYGYRIPEALSLNPDIWVFMGSTNDGTPNSTDVSNALRAIRTGGSTAPIIVLGCWSLNSETQVLAMETALVAGIASAADPLGKTFYIPILNDPYFPWISGSWNNNPAPSGITNTAAVNANIYINTGDSIHPVDAGTEYLARRICQAIRQYVLPNLQCCPVWFVGVGVRRRKKVRYALDA